MVNIDKFRGLIDSPALAPKKGAIGKSYQKRSKLYKK